MSKLRAPWLHTAVAALALPLLTPGCVDDGADVGEATGTEAPDGLADDLTALVSYTVTASGDIRGRKLYAVSSDLEDAQQDEELQLAIWAEARTVFESHLRWVNTFVVFTDGADGTLAQVFTGQRDPTRWALAVDQEDALDENGEVGGDALTFTLVHELAHIVSLNAEQVELDADLAADPEDLDLIAAARADCDTYFLDEGCSLPDAYIYAFHEAFWTDLVDYEAIIDAIEDEAAQEEAIAAQYAETPERFVSEYAATNVAEDFAESFATFALEAHREGGLERDEKVKFFEQFPELVALRDDLQGAGLSVTMSSLAPRHARAHRCR